MPRNFFPLLTLTLRSSMQPAVGYVDLLILLAGSSHEKNSDTYRWDFGFSMVIRSGPVLGSATMEHVAYLGWDLPFPPGNQQPMVPSSSRSLVIIEQGSYEV
ncbi:hypothetical protein AWENTII_011286 [Aspergillus wentii]